MCGILFGVFLTSCKKEYSYEGGFVNGSLKGTAVYTLAGAGGECLGATISGKYYKGILLTAQNTVTLNVNVDSIGSFYITTNSLDGFNFSGSGNFTVVGAQTVILKASGTPSATGLFTFSPPVGLGCDFVVSIVEASAAQAVFSFAGSPGGCSNAKVLGDYISENLVTNYNSVSIDVNVESAGMYSISTDTLDGIYFFALGNFTRTGKQVVTLTAAGRPAFARNLSFSLNSPSIQSCNFNLSVVDPPPLATYVLESGYGDTTSPCIYTIQGGYNAGISLDSTNTVSMSVYVTIVGNYTISTNSINGMQFSHSGTFTTTGSQYVSLKGEGKPGSKGSFTFSPNIVGPHPLGGQACSFVVTVL